MTTERDPRTRIVLSWLREEAHENAERVLLRALDEVDTTPQRRSRWAAWRTNRMNTYAKLIAAAAAGVLVVAVAGYQFLPARSGLGGTTATPTVSPTVPPFGLAGNGVIALAKDGDIVVADRPGGDTRPLVAGPESDYNPTFSPDGTRLAFERATDLGPVRLGVLMLADADGANVVQLTPEPLETYGTPWSFAPDGRSLMTLARIDGAWRVVVRPVDPAAALAVLDIRLWDAGQEIAESGGPSFNPTNSREILVLARLESDGPRGIHVYDLATGGIRTIVEQPDEQYLWDAGWLPDGEHIRYRSTAGGSRVVGADGAGDQAFDALIGRLSPFSNDGTRIVAERGGEGAAEPTTVVVPINGDGAPVVLACGDAPDIECGPSWIWSPDDSMLIGTVYHETSRSGESSLTETYVLVNARTGEVTELDWRDMGSPAWQRVAP